MLGAFAVHARPLARGALGAAAGLAKFASLAVLPLLAAHGLGDRPVRERAPLLARFAAGAALIAALAAAIVLPHTGPAALWDRTVGYQAGRDAPFSVWGLYGGDWQTARSFVQVLAVVLAAGLPFARRRDDLAGLAALCGAVLVAWQLTTNYWFYFYVLWALPAILIAVLGRAGLPETALSPQPAPAPARSRRPAAAASSG